MKTCTDCSTACFLDLLSEAAEDTAACLRARPCAPTCLPSSAAAFRCRHRFPRGHDRLTSRWPASLRGGVSRCVLIGVAMLVTVTGAWGQAVSVSPHTQPLAAASIHGVIVGAGGDVYDGVHVILTASGASPAATQSQITDTDGAFSFSAVPCGPFRLTLSSPGFVTQIISGVLHAGEDYDARTVILPMATATSEVEVSASHVEVAQAQLDLEEKQRVLGVLPNYLVTYDPHAASLTTRQKFQLAWKSAVDPVSFGAAGLIAGINQASNGLAGYGQGSQGFARRFGAVYADTFVGTMIGGAVLPSLFHQDPRYFVKGTGSVRSRVWYAVYNAVMCKGDNGRWQVNYSGLIGGLAAGGVSQLYYPPGDRATAGGIFAGSAIAAGTNIFGNLAQEFVIRKFTPTLEKRYRSPKGRRVF